MAVLENKDQFALVIWGQVLNKREGIPEYPENFHIGFYQEDQEAVWNMYRKLREEENLRLEAEPKYSSVSQEIPFDPNSIIWKIKCP